MARLLITWIVAALASFLVLFVPIVIVCSIFFSVDREEGWGANKETYPLLVVTHDGGKPTAHILMQKDLAALSPSSNWTFIVRPEERQAIAEQVRAKHDETGAKEGSFEDLSVGFEDRSDGQLEVHLRASRYIDARNESWYIAHEKSITPIARRQRADIGVGMASAGSAVVLTAIVSPIVASLVVYRRHRKASSSG